MTRTLGTITGYNITLLTDNDRLTQAEVGMKQPNGMEYALGSGMARRKPGDTRDQALGELLALERCFKDAAANIRKELDARGYYDDLTADKVL